MTEKEISNLERKIEETQTKKERAIKALEQGIGSADRFVVKILIAGLLISIMVTISGGLVFIITQFFIL